MLGVVTGPPQHRPGIARHRLHQKPPSDRGKHRHARSRCAQHTASLPDQIDGRPQALHGPALQGRHEANRAAQFDHELVKLRSPLLLG